MSNVYSFSGNENAPQSAAPETHENTGDDFTDGVLGRLSVVGAGENGVDLATYSQDPTAIPYDYQKYPFVPQGAEVEFDAA